MKASTLLLHYRAGHNVFKGLLQFGQVSQAGFDDVGRPLVDFRLGVRVSSDGIFDHVPDYAAHLVDDELRLFSDFVHWRYGTFSKLVLVDIIFLIYILGT